jgi:hypothetical protein
LRNRVRANLAKSHVAGPRAVPAQRPAETVMAPSSTGSRAAQTGGVDPDRGDRRTPGAPPEALGIRAAPGSDAGRFAGADGRPSASLSGERLSSDYSGGSPVASLLLWHGTL